MSFTSTFLTPDNSGLSEDELDELDQFLLSDAVSDESMILESLDGYLTAIVAGPTTIMPSQWLPGVWGPSEEHAPEFESMAQYQRIIELLFRHMNMIVSSLMHNSDEFEPLFTTSQYEGSDREFLDGEAWAYGFMRGVALCRSDWQPLYDSAEGQAWLRPLRLLGDEDVCTDQDELTRTPALREAIAEQIPACIGAVYRYWLPYRQAVSERHVATLVQRQQTKDGRKVGRNDPCPCGSGNKYKKCCGAPLH
jgi:uncharacterized protein